MVFSSRVLQLSCDRQESVLIAARGRIMAVHRYAFRRGEVRRQGRQPVPGRLRRKPDGTRPARPRPPIRWSWHADLPAISSARSRSRRLGHLLQGPNANAPRRAPFVTGQACKRIGVCPARLARETEREPSDEDRRRAPPRPGDTRCRLHATLLSAARKTARAQKMRRAICAADKDRLLAI